MKAKQLFYLLLALPLLAVACNEEPEVKPTPAPAEAELNITSATSVDFTADGGNGEITYELKNAVEGTKLTAEADAAWITDVTVADKVTYFVEANETEEAREATITLTYGALTKSVAVKQAAKANENPNPELEASIWSLVGTHNGWEPASGTTMYIIEGYFVAYGFELTTASEFKFVKNGAWGGDLGGEGIPAEANCHYKTGSTNIKVVADGKYDIYLNEATDTFYVMEEGKLPEQATEPTKPVVDKWELVGDFEGSNWDGTEFAKDGDRFVLQDVKFANANNEGCAFKVGNNGAWYGTQSTEALEINTPIALDGDNNILVNAEVGVAYDFYFDATAMKVWVMEDGKTPEDAPQPEPETIDLTFNTATVTAYEYSNSYIEVEFEGETDNLVVYFNTDDKLIEGGEWVIDNTYKSNTVAAMKTTLNGKRVAEGGKFTIIRDIDQYNVSATFSVDDDDYTALFNGNIVLPDETNMGIPEAVTMAIAEVSSTSSNEGASWSLTFLEDSKYNYMHTIVLLVDPANVKLPNDEAYSIADGSIDAQTSLYRSNSSGESEKITSASFTLTTNDNKTTTIKGTFVTANKQVVNIDWTGAVKNFNYSTGEESNHFTEFSSVTTKWFGTKNPFIQFVSADGRLNTLDFDFYLSEAASDKVVPEGVYSPGGQLTLDGQYTYIQSATLTVAHENGAYKLTFDVTDKSGRQITGEYTGAMSGATNPE